MSTAGKRAAYLLKEKACIGPYVVIRPLGAGGMGEVYLVEHQQLRKRYALKILPVDLASDAQFIDRFRIEARVMADLEHSGIVRVHNFGEDQGRHYLVMDYVEGPDGAPRTLEDELAWGKKLPEQMVLSIAFQLCDALIYAHQFPQGAIIHRDLKPSNILIQKTGSSGVKPDVSPEPEFRIKVADFGLAKVLGTEYIRDVLDRSVSLTSIPAPKPTVESQETECSPAGSSSTAILGTYDYMSPEQKTGQEVDARSDIYAVGLILYRMLTGHKPEGSYEPPSKEGVNRRWDTIIGKCLKRQSGDRYGSVQQLKDDLVHFNTPMHRKRWFPIITAAAAALLVGLILHFREEPRIPDQPIKRSTIYTEADKPYLLSFKVKARGGADLVVRRNREVVVQSPVHAWWGVKIKLKPGVYTFEVSRPGYRTISEDIAVGDDQPDQWSVTMEKEYGFVRITQIEGVQISILDRRGKATTFRPVDQQSNSVVYKLPRDRYEVVITKKNFMAMSRVIDAKENQPIEIVAKLSQLPGRLMITCESSAEIWDNGKLIGRTGEWIKNIPSGKRDVKLQREGYRITSVTVDIPPNGEFRLVAPKLLEPSARLTIQVEINAIRDVAPADLPKEGMLSINDGTPQKITIPSSLEVKNLGRSMTYALTIPGFDIRYQWIKLNDLDEKTVVYNLIPHTSTFTVTANVPSAIYNTKDVPSSRSWSRRVFGNRPIGNTDEPLVLKSFVRHELTAVADGFQPVDFVIYSTQPGKTNDPVVLQLERLPPAAIQFVLIPTDAVVSVNGIVQTNFPADLPSNVDLPVSVSAPGFVTINDTIIAEPGEKRTIKFKLKKSSN